MFSARANLLRSASIKDNAPFCHCEVRAARRSCGRHALSLDLRKRIVKAYDAGTDTRGGVAARFGVSVGMVKKLLQQRRRIGELRAQHHRAGRKPKIRAAERLQLRQQLAAKPDLTLAELRERTGLKCTLPAIHYVLADMGLIFKKRRSARSCAARVCEYRQTARDDYGSS